MFVAVMSQVVHRWATTAGWVIVREQWRMRAPGDSFGKKNELLTRQLTSLLAIFLVGTFSSTKVSRGELTLERLREGQDQRLAWKCCIGCRVSGTVKDLLKYLLDAFRDMVA